MELSYAIVHGDPPEVFIAEDMDTLHWVLALEVVARSSTSSLGHAVGAIRQALLEEQWAEAVVEWINATDQPIDVYPSVRVFQAADVAMAGAELQFTPLFAGFDPDSATDP
jgi:hypothetical protein